MARKQRKYMPEFKLETVLEGMRGEKSIAQLCRDRDIKDSLYYKWRQEFLEHAPELFADKRQAVDDGKDEQIAELERMVGRLTMENELLKKGSAFLSLMGRHNGQ
jgi:transposase-like protein